MSKLLLDPSLYGESQVVVHVFCNSFFLLIMNSELGGERQCTALNMGTTKFIDVPKHL
jgi:hypothetical protein